MEGRPHGANPEQCFLFLAGEAKGHSRTDLCVFMENFVLLSAVLTDKSAAKHPLGWMKLKKGTSGGYFEDVRGDVMTW